MNLIFPAAVGRPLTLLVCLTVVASSANTRAAKSPISLDVLQRRGYGTVELLKLEQNKLYVPAEINGKKINLLLDTGWGSPGISMGLDPSEFQIVPEKGGHI